jgi:cell division protein FtsZ
LGGGTGTGAIVALSEELRKRFADSPVPRLVIGVVTLPFEVETARMEIAKKGLDNLKKSCDTVVVIDNDRLVKIAGNLPFREALGVANTTIGKFIKGITESITTASLINLDYADLRAIMQGAGLASIGVGEGTGEGRVEQAVERAINGRLLDIEDVTKAWGLLIHVSGGEDLTLFEVSHAAENCEAFSAAEGKKWFGVQGLTRNCMEASLMAVVTGVESAFLRRSQKRIGPIKLR